MRAYKKQSRLTISKCMAIWNKQSRSTQYADKIKELIGVYLKCPKATRWNSFYDSVKFIFVYVQLKSKFSNLCDALDVVRFSKIDIEWLEEYIKVLEPLANCLEILQGEKNMYLGYLIPSINQLIKKYVTMKNDVCLKICGPLIPILIENLEKDLRPS